MNNLMDNLAMAVVSFAMIVGTVVICVSSVFLFNDFEVEFVIISKEKEAFEKECKKTGVNNTLRNKNITNDE